MDTFTLVASIVLLGFIAWGIARIVGRRGGADRDGGASWTEDGGARRDADRGETHDAGDGGGDGGD